MGRVDGNNLLPTFLDLFPSIFFFLVGHHLRYRYMGRNYVIPTIINVHPFDLLKMNPTRLNPFMSKWVKNATCHPILVWYNFEPNASKSKLILF